VDTCHHGFGRPRVAEWRKLPPGMGLVAIILKEQSQIARKDSHSA